MIYLIIFILIAIVFAVGYIVGYLRGAYDKPFYDYTDALFRAYLDECIQQRENN